MLVVLWNSWQIRGLPYTSDALWLQDGTASSMQLGSDSRNKLLNHCHLQVVYFSVSLYNELTFNTSNA